MGPWKPINYQGSIYDDPRDELRARVNHARKEGEQHFTISVELAIACADIRLCHDTRTFLADEDGPLPKPAKVYCTKQENHLHQHSNGYYNWS